MDNGATSGSCFVKTTKGNKSRRSWTPHEEEVLIQAFKDVIKKGWKSENGFKVGYLNLLESAMKGYIPGCDLCGTPHINSKVHVWKKTYSTLVTILSKSRIGWNDTDNTIEATDETWDSLIKADASIRTMRHKQWTHYNDWCEIFGNDRATGEREKNFKQVMQDVLNLDSDVRYESFVHEPQSFPPTEVAIDSISETHTPSFKLVSGATLRTNKRKNFSEADESMVEAINNLVHITKNTMADLV